MTDATWMTSKRCKMARSVLADDKSLNVRGIVAFVVAASGTAAS